LPVARRTEQERDLVRRHRVPGALLGRRFQRDLSRLTGLLLAFGGAGLPTGGLLDDFSGRRDRFVFACGTESFRENGPLFQLDQQSGVDVLDAVPPIVLLAGAGFSHRVRHFAG
jgi:hypothetical protein